MSSIEEGNITSIRPSACGSKDSKSMGAGVDISPHVWQREKAPLLSRAMKLARNRIASDMKRRMSFPERCQFGHLARLYAPNQAQFNCYLVFIVSLSSISHISPSHCPAAFLFLNNFKFSGSGPPIQVALCVWSRSSSSVFGCIKADRGPRFITSHGMKAPNCSTRRLTGYTSSHRAAHTWCENIHFKHSHGVRPDWSVPHFVYAELWDWDRSQSKAIHGLKSRHLHSRRMRSQSSVANFNSSASLCKK